MPSQEWFEGISKAVGLTAAVATAPGTIELFLLTMGALFPERRRSTPLTTVPWRAAVLIPAHNEALGIRSTIESVRATIPNDLEADTIVIAGRYR